MGFLFSFGMLSTILELHLDEFNLTATEVALCFNLESVTYFVLSLTIGYVFSSTDQRILITIGNVMLGISYLMLGPWGLIFNKSLGVILAALVMIGFGQCLSYRNFPNSFQYTLYDKKRTYGLFL